MDVRIFYPELVASIGGFMEALFGPGKKNIVAEIGKKLAAVVS